MRKTIFYIFIIVTVLIAFTGFEYFKFSDHKLHVIVCDVGQGDAILIVTPAKGQILIDGGPDKSVLECLTRHMPFWDRSIDMIILTHPHADHYVGLIDVIDRYHLDGFYTEEVDSNSDGFKLLKAKLASKNLSAKYLTEGESFRDKSGAKIKILWPRLEEIEESDHNASNIDLNGLSVVAYLTYGNFSALLTGDAEKNVLDYLISRLGRLNLLKVPHHGSSGGVSDEFLTKTLPDLALISLGKNNKFGHPSEDTLEILNRHSIKVFRTDRDGEIDVFTDGKKIELKKSKN